MKRQTAGRCFSSGPGASSGFTLLELMIVVAIVAILVALAIPNYQAFVIRSNRSKAMTALAQMALQEERFLLSYGRYTTNVDGPMTSDPNTSGLGLPNSTTPDPSAYYTLTAQITCNGLCYT